MSTAHSLGGLIKWIGRDTYRERMAEVLDSHLATAAASSGLSLEAFSEQLVEPVFITIWGVAFEDFISQQLDEGGPVALLYLKRRGWKESAATRAYVAGLARSVMSLYAVSDVDPGKGFALTDLVRGGPPIRIEERSASRSLVDGDRIGARVIELRHSCVISGGLLAFAPETAEKLRSAIAEVARKLPGAATLVAERHETAFDPDALDPAMALDVALSQAPALFSTLWLQEKLEAIANPTLPQLFNSDGEPFELQSLHFPLAKGVRLATVRGRLNARFDELWAESDSYWNWLAADPETGASAAPPAEGLVLSTTMEEGGVVLGNLSLEGRTLRLSVNSAARAARGRALIAATLGELVGPPTLETHELGDLAGQGHGGPADDPAPSLSPDEERALVHRTLTRHYRQQLDQPVPALGQATPRRLAAAAGKREEVAAWLCYLEWESLRSGDAHMAAYDFDWIWAELGLDDLRG